MSPGQASALDLAFLIRLYKFQRADLRLTSFSGFSGHCTDVAVFAKIGNQFNTTSTNYT